MDFSESHTPRRPTSLYQLTDSTPVGRKPLSQINAGNLSNHQSPAVFKRKFGHCNQDIGEENINRDYTKEQSNVLSGSLAASDSSKSNYQHGCSGFLSQLPLRDSSNHNHNAVTPGNSTPSPAQRPNILFTPVTDSNSGSSAASDSSKSNYQHGCSGFLSQLPLRDSSNHNYHAVTPGNSTPSPAQRPNILFTPVTDSNRGVEMHSQDTSAPYAQNTPKPYVIYNPFEECAEVLQLPTVSPSLFKEVVSPSVKQDNDFSWAIDHLALINPTPIETSPFRQMDLPLDPEYERKAQDAIDRFFNSALVVPSPWTNSSSRSLNLMSALFSSSSSSNLHQMSSPSSLVALSKTKPREDIVRQSSQDDRTNSVWCQTELSLPPILPKEVEEALAPFCTFTQDQSWQPPGEETDETSALNTTNLRRKLLFSDDHSGFQQTSEPPSARVSLESATHQEPCSSPASTGPLPLDEGESPPPWGVSMIRPGSRVSLSHSPTQGKSFASSSSSPHRAVELYHGVSPISYFSPDGFRTLPSPVSDDNTPSSGQTPFLASPKLSPILRSPGPPRVKKYLHSREEQHTEGELAPSRWESTAIGSSERGSLSTQGAGAASAGSKNQQRTPLIKNSSSSDSPRNPTTTKASPHFSSSPIKCRSSTDSASRPELNKDSDDGLNSPKFSESPPISPIAWEFESRPPSQSGQDQSARVGTVDQFFGSPGLQTRFFLHSHVDEMEDEAQEDVPDCHMEKRSLSDSPTPQQGDTRTPCRRVVREIDSVISSSSTFMDTDSHHGFEGSTFEETWNGQDTGYHTGTSLQTTNLTNQSTVMVPFSSSSVTKECKSNHHCVCSPQKTRGHNFDDVMAGCHGNDREKVSSERH